MPTVSVTRKSCGWLRCRADTRRKKPTSSCAKITASWPASRGLFWKDCSSIKTMPNSTPCWMPPFMTSTRRRLPDSKDRPKWNSLMAIPPSAGKPAPKDLLIDLATLERAYYDRRPDVNDRYQLVAFGTSGHRGTPLKSTFAEAHILAITQAICDYRRGQGTDGPLYMGKDTHALSAPSQRTALEVLAANGVETIIQRDDEVTPTPVVSRAILAYNRGRKDHPSDGIVITPSHNPPEDGGFKYNTTNGGPADTDVTQWVQDRANELLRGGN